MTAYSHFSEMSESDLVGALDVLKRTQLNLRFQKATGQLEKPTLIGEARRDIARVKTALNAIQNARIRLESAAIQRAMQRPSPPRVSKGYHAYQRYRRNYLGTGSLAAPFAQSSREGSSPTEGTGLTETSDVGSMILEPAHRRLLGEILDMAQEENRDESPLEKLVSGDVELTNAMVRKIVSTPPPQDLTDTDVNTARHAIKTLLPMLTSGSLRRASLVARVLGWLASFEPKLKEHRTAAPAERLSKLLERYSVPCFIDIDVALDDGRRSGRFVVTTTDTIELGKGAGQVRVHPKRGGVMEIYVSDSDAPRPRRALSFSLDEAGDVQEQVPFHLSAGPKPSVLTVYYNGKPLAERAAFAR